MNRYNPYIKQSIELAEEAKKQIVVSCELINSITDNEELGKVIREKLIKRIKESD